MTEVTAGDIRISTDDGEIPGYSAAPRGGSDLPAVLVVHEIFGVNPYIRDVCRRLGQLGYLAIAPELYTRQGDVSQLSNIQQIVGIVAKVPDAQVMADLDASAAWAKASGLGDIERLGITGFCWGGRITWLYAAHSAQVKAGVAWYGRLAGDRDALHSKHPVDLAADLKAPVLGLYGALDQSIPVSTVEQMQAALAEAGQPSEFVVYPNAGHAFHADYRPSYVEDAAKDGWQRMQAWFNKLGVK